MHYGQNQTALTAGVVAGPRQTTLVQIGASLGIAANCIGWAVFLLMCAGFDKAVALGVLAFGLSAVGMVLTILGGVTQNKAGDVETHVLASIFINLFGLVGGIMQIAVWKGWTILAK